MMNAVQAPQSRHPMEQTMLPINKTIQAYYTQQYGNPERQRQYLDSAEAILAELKPADPGWAREV